MLEAPVSIRTPFDAIGGSAGVRRLVDAFYDRMDAEPAFAELRRMHGADLGPMRDRLADWLQGWMVGPPVYALRHPGRPCVMAAHAPFRIDGEGARQWLECMRAALAEAELGAEWRVLIDEAFARMCAALRNA